MFNESKSAYAVLLGVAGAIRTLAGMAETINSLLGHLADDGPEGRILAELAISLDNLAPLLVLAGELQVVAESMAVRDPVLRKMRRRARQLEAARVASERSAAKNGIAHYEQDEEKEEAPDTERGM